MGVWAGLLVGLLAVALLWRFQSKHPEVRTEWDVLFVTDKDHFSRNLASFEWSADITVATLRFDPKMRNFTLHMNDTISISSKVSYANRSMELSALEFFRGHLMAFCDRSGYVKTMMRTGDGLEVTPFKTEWVTLKDNTMLIGGTGKEWTLDDGSVINEHMKWVKQMDETGRIVNVDWKFVYDKLREVSNTSYPGYIVHEAVNFNHRRRQWVFLPRRMSTLPYSDPVDARMGANTLFLASEDFTHITTRQVGPLELDWGFTCIKPILFPVEYVKQHPDLPDYYLGIKAKESFDEKGESIHEGSRVILFDLEGTVYVELSSLHTSNKYEGIAFLPGDLTFSQLQDWQKQHAFGAYPTGSSKSYI